MTKLIRPRASPFLVERQIYIFAVPETIVSKFLSESSRSSPPARPEPECQLAYCIRDQFCLGGLRSVARIFSPLLARKSSGFARILHFLPENGYLKNSRGAAAPSPQPPPPASYAYASQQWRIQAGAQQARAPSKCRSSMFLLCFFLLFLSHFVSECFTIRLSQHVRA